jgi:protein-S-isoprenylcysteine O-methyltransferase Ste14
VVAAILVVIRLEERELRDRFGAEYETYRARVPALVPRLDWKRIRGR